MEVEIDELREIVQAHRVGGSNVYELGEVLEKLGFENLGRLRLKRVLLHRFGGLTMTLEEMLTRMQHYGRPYLMCHDDGSWSASIKLNIVTPGGQFEIKAAFNVHRTARAATGS